MKMSNRDLLVEIGIEEMPARFILAAEKNFKEQLIEWLKEQRIAHGDVESFSTPRRLAVRVCDVASSQEDVEEEAKGPAKKIAQDEQGNWSKAAQGFVRGQGVTVDDIFFKEIKGVEYVHVKKFIKGEQTIELLPELQNIITSLHFPNHMRWGNYDLKFLRPLRWVVALFGEETITFSIEKVASSNTTFGHRFLGKKVAITTPDAYEQTLLDQYVIANYEQRQQMIVEQMAAVAKENNWVIPSDEELLEEVTNLVEYPTVFFGTFDEQFLNLPEEVLITSMKSHQRYFPVKNEKDELLPFFIGVRNGNDYKIDQVVKGNEKVLHARLADGDFFYAEDQKLTIDEALTKLETIVYHEKIGTLSEKVARIEKIATQLGESLGKSVDELTDIQRAAHISKFDLVTNMVDEFPELQGIMGEKYALKHDEKKQVAQAIREHYMPRHADDNVPASAIGSIISIADKLDSIVSAFAIGLIPTGSQDPYALRRQTAGIIQILAQNNWDLTLPKLLKLAIDVIGSDLQVNEGLYEQLVQFFQLRLKYLLQEKHIQHDIIEAVLTGELTSVPEMIGRAEALQSRKNDADFKEVIESLSRVLNIANKWETGETVDQSLFENDQEKALYAETIKLHGTFTQTANQNERLDALFTLSPTITDYFNHTMVMCEDKRVKDNRLTQMKLLAEHIRAFADMGEVQVK